MHSNCSKLRFDTMTIYLNIDKLEAIDVAEFQRTNPYPWANPHGLITDEGYAELLGNLPDLASFEAKMRKERRGGQKPHDRYSLEYTDRLHVPAPWQAFIDELRGDRYRDAMARLYGARKLEFRFHWHYTPPSASVSPHCDAVREYGSHIFYFNEPDTWDEAWGGQTLVLDDGARLDRNSAPTFDAFDAITPTETKGNTSMFFRNGPHAWHGVRAISCPEGELRKVFIVVINPDSLLWKVRDRAIGKKIQRF